MTEIEFCTLNVVNRTVDLGLHTAAHARKKSFLRQTVRPSRFRSVPFSLRHSRFTLISVAHLLSQGFGNIDLRCCEIIDASRDQQPLQLGILLQNPHAEDDVLFGNERNECLEIVRVSA